tara:strand:+ start:2609 stop:2836 length:228 start_codon:yes stop_codon:yes gene_type:complete
MLTKLSTTTKTSQRLSTLQVLEQIRVHEAECALRLDRINEKFEEINNKMISIENKMWIITALIVGASITNIFLPS